MKVLSKRKINLTMLRSLSFRGIPSDLKSLRPLVWKVLLGYLPLETKQWDSFVKNQKKIYTEYRKELIIEPRINRDGETIANEKLMDHPLSTNPKSLWNKYFKDQELWEEIEKDIKRTRSDIMFFFEPVDPEKNDQSNKEQLEI